MALKCYVLILSSGSGERFGSIIPKQFLKVRGKTILERSIEIFNDHPMVTDIIVVTNPSYLGKTNKILNQAGFLKLRNVIPGGKTRQLSSYYGLKKIMEYSGLVIIHDAVRPFISKDVITECIKSLDNFDAVAVAVPVTDTIYRTGIDNYYIEEIPERKFYFSAQTPQCFKLQLIRQAHELAFSNNDINHTDDASLIVKYNLSKVTVIQGNTDNIKITYSEDLRLAKMIADKRK